MNSWLIQILKSPEIVAVLLTALIAAITRYLQPAARVIWGISHGFTFLVPSQEKQPQSYPLSTGSVFVRNAGRRTANDVEIVLNYRPQHFQIWPALGYETAETPEHHFIIKLKNLGPGEFTTVELVSANHELPITLRVRSPLGEAKRVGIAPMRVMPVWFNRAAVLLFSLGLFTVTYFLIRLIGFLSGL